MFMTSYGRKLDFPNRLATLPGEQQEYVLQILDIHKRIEYCWVQYPFRLSIFTALIICLWVGFGGVVSFLFAVPVWKLALLKSTERLLKKLEKELETYHGQWANWFISTAELDEVPLRLVNSASRRGLIDWFQL